MSKVLDSEGAEKKRSQLYGWISGAWQKQPMLLGYSGTVAEGLSDDSVDAGTNDLEGTHVPSGEIWYIAYAAIRIDGSDPDELMIRAVVDSEQVPVYSNPTPSARRWYTTPLAFVLAEGDYLLGRVTGATAGDDFYFRYVGWKIDIDQ